MQGQRSIFDYCNRQGYVEALTACPPAASSSEEYLCQATVISTLIDFMAHRPTGRERKYLMAQSEPVLVALRNLRALQCCSKAMAAFLNAYIEKLALRVVETYPSCWGPAPLAIRRHVEKRAEREQKKGNFCLYNRLARLGHH